MHEVVESIRLQFCRKAGLDPKRVHFFYRDHTADDGCGCALYYQLLDSCPVRIPVGKGEQQS